MAQPLRDASNKTPINSLMRGMADVSLHSKAPGSAGRRMFNLQNQSVNHSYVVPDAKKGLRKREMTPTRNGSYSSASVMQGDRFVGVRRNELDIELANHLMSHGPVDSTFNTSNSAPSSPAKNTEKDQLKKMMRVKSAGNLTDVGEDDRILVYKKNAAPLPPPGHISQAKPSSSVKKSSRYIPLTCERILDAPEFKDDFYMNLVDWSSRGVVAVILGYSLYLWNADSGDIQILFELDGNNEMELPTSVKWSKDGCHLSVGFRDGTLKIYDPERQISANGRLEIRTMKVPRQSRNGVQAWRGAVVSAGYQSGQIIHHDVRVAKHITGTFDGHNREVVGMHWSYDERLLATGSGDNTVRIWDGSLTGSETQNTLFTLDEHIGSVRAVQFSNFKSSMLATGGGAEDKSIKLWNIHSGEMVKNIATDAAVNAIVFNAEYREMMSAHGNGALHIWKHPLYTSVASLSGHSPQRAISAVPSPCGQFILSAGADETLRLWNAFKVDKSTAKLNARNKLMGSSIR